MTTEPHPRHVAAPAEAILDEVERAVVGKRERARARAARPARRRPRPARGLPGLAKTLIARSFAPVDRPALRAASSSRRTCCPPTSRARRLRPARRATFDFRPGPMFANLLLGDEINRAPPKTQAALLEAMQERQVTADGVDARRSSGPSSCSRPRTRSSTRAPTRCPRPSSTASCCGPGRLPGGRRRVGACSTRRRARGTTRWRSTPRRPPRAARAAARRRGGARRRSIGRYMVALVDRDAASAESRSAPARAAPSPCSSSRGAGRAARPRLRHPRDVKAVAVPALAHRLVLRPELWVRRIDAGDVVARVLDDVPAPPAMEPSKMSAQRVADPR